MPFVGRWLDS